MNRPSPDDMKVMGVMEYVQELEEENKKLKEEGDMAITHNLLLIEENKRLRKGIDIRLDSMGVKYIITKEGDYFAKSDFKITE